jgi:hypothetical protein
MSSQFITLGSLGHSSINVTRERAAATEQKEIDLIPWFTQPGEQSIALKNQTLKGLVRKRCQIFLNGQPTKGYLDITGFSETKIYQCQESNLGFLIVESPLTESGWIRKKENRTKPVLVINPPSNNCQILIFGVNSGNAFRVNDQNVLVFPC